MPDAVYPLLHVGVHELPLARLDVHGLASPFESAVDASHGLGLHANVLVYEPYEHDLLPDAVYPPLHVGVHEAPLSRLESHVPAPPFVGASAALHALPAQLRRRAFRGSAHVKGRSVGSATAALPFCTCPENAAIFGVESVFVRWAGIAAVFPTTIACPPYQRILAWWRNERTDPESRMR